MVLKKKRSVLICDIGGTNVRFAIYTPDDKQDIYFDGKYKCVAFSSFEKAVERYLREKQLKPSLCIIGAAGEMDEKETRVLVTNTPWKADKNKLQAYFPFMKHIRMVNDFALQGWALSELQPHQYQSLFGGQKIDLTKGSITVIGPGTGLGTCIVLQDGHNPRTIKTSEAGHSTIPHVDFGESPLNQERDYLLYALKDYYHTKKQTPVIEHIVSGTGLTNVYHVFHDGYIPQKQEERIPCEQIEKLAQKGDPTALKAFRFFNAYLGAHAGTLVATTKTKQVFFCGGMMASPWVSHHLTDTPEFMRQFTSRAGLSDTMKQVRFAVSTERDMAKLGAVARAKLLLDLEHTEKRQQQNREKVFYQLSALETLIQMENPVVQRKFAQLKSAIEQEHQKQSRIYQLKNTRN